MKGHNYGLCKKCGRPHEPTRGTLGKHLRFSDIEQRKIRARENGAKHRKILPKQIEEICALYRAGKSSIKIGKKYNVNYNTIIKYLHKNGEVIRTKKDFYNIYGWTEKQKKAFEAERHVPHPTHGWHRGRNKGPAYKIDVNCDSCGGIIKLWPCDLKALRHHFCNRRCYLSYQKINGKSLATIAKPNHGEMELLDILHSINPTWCFTGNGALWINGKNPDFWDGKQLTVELFGGSWHTAKEGRERIEHFQKEGYNCLIIWYSELRNKQKLTERLKLFSNGGNNISVLES